MRSKITLALAIAVLCLVSTIRGHAQQTQAGGPPQGMPPMPKPGPEHAVFQEDAGTWDATVELFMAPGAPPATSKGVEINTVGCGGLCLITDFKSEMLGSAFHGHGTASWDPLKKKYVGSWTDSMTQGIGISEATFDPATKTFTGWMESPDPSGQAVKMKTVTEYKGPGSRVFTMYAPGPDGKEMVTMRITYARRK